MGGAGGGIATDANTGDTTIAPTLKGGKQANWTGWDQYGTPKSLLGGALAGIGYPVIVFRSGALLTGSLGPYLLYTTAASCAGGVSVCPNAGGIYELHWTGTVSSASIGNTITVSVSYIDQVQQQTITCGNASSPFGNFGQTVSAICNFYAIPGTPIFVSFSTSSNSVVYWEHTYLVSYGD